MEKIKKGNSIKKILALTLAFMMVFTGMGIGQWGLEDAWADNESDYEIIIGSSGVTSGYHSLDQTTHSLGSTSVNKTYIFRFNEPSFTLTNSSGLANNKDKRQDITGATGIGPTFARNKSREAKEWEAYSFTESKKLTDLGYSVDPNSTKFYYTYFMNLSYAILIEITPNGTPFQVISIETSELDSAIESADDKQGNCYTTADRYNGKTTITDLVDGLRNDATIKADLNAVKVFYTYDSWNKVETRAESFWALYEAAMSRVNAIYPQGESGTRTLADGVTQKQVDAAAALLEAAIANLIPTTQVNPTELYELLTAEYRWSGDQVQKAPWYVGAYEYMNIKSSSVTAITWDPYDKALSEGQAMLDSLYDENGEPTSVNTADAQTNLDAKVGAIQVALGNLVSKDYYESAYQTFTERMDEAKALLETYGPDKLEKSAYTADSWNEYLAAYETLKTASEYKITESANYQKGGTKADYEAIKGFANKIESFRNKVNALVSDKDITVSVSYINNSAARHPIRLTGTDIYHNDSLNLEKGNTTIKGIIDAAGITFDPEPTYYSIPRVVSTGTISKEPIGILLMISVNGSCRGIYKYENGGASIPIQLHENDEVSIVRVPPGSYITEASSGYDTTTLTYYLSFSTSVLGDSIGKINIDSITQNVKVGDTVSIKASAEGTYLKNQGKPLSAENLALYVSAPYSEAQNKIDGLLQTAAVTDAEGNAEYVFREPGWYTVALFDLAKDTPQFTDVFDVTTKGNFPGMKAGAYVQLYVADTENEDTILNKWRSTNLAEAKALYERYHDYDFAEGYYAADFTDAYDTLVEHQRVAETFKGLMDAYDTDFAALCACAKTARNHEALVEAVRKTLGYFPETADEVTYRYKELLNRLKTEYGQLNDYEKTNLLTPAEQAKADMLLAIVPDTIETPAKTAIKVASVEPMLPLGGRNQDFGGSPWSNEVYSTDPTGTEKRTFYSYGIKSTEFGKPVVTVPSTNGMNAYEGDRIVIDRLMHQSDDIYWAVYSIDGGQNWTLAELVKRDYADSILMRAELLMPETEEDTLTITLKGISKAEYEAAVAESEKASDAEKAEAKAAIQATYDSYDLSKYDEAGKEALLKALNDGLTEVETATSSQEVTDARKKAAAAMAAVAVKGNGTGEQPSSPTYDSGKTVGKVHVIVENTTCSVTEENDKSTAPAFNTAEAGLYGSFINGWYDLGENDSMMTCVLKALETSGFSWEGTGGTGYGITYLSSITKGDKTLAEFSGGRKSGWMGTLNDWFTNEGFDKFSVANGKLENGDEIHVMYTCDYGVDLGGTWDSADTSLKSLSVSGGTLAPAFSSSQMEYTLMISGETASVKLTPEAANKNYQARIFLNSYNKDSAMYKRTETISVKSGDILYVGIGESGWPTMNASGSGTKYTIKVVSGSDATAVKNMINSLKDVTYGNYKSQKAAIESARAAYNALSADAKKDVAADTLKKLTDAEEQIKFYTEIDDAKTKLNALTSTSSSSQVQAALAAYNKLSDEQKEYITKADVEKFNELAEKYNISSIAGSEQMPESEVVTTGKTGSAVTESPTEVTVSGTTATASVKKENVEAVLKQAKENKSTEIVLNVAASDTKGAETVKIQLDTATVKSIVADTSASITVKTENGQVSLDREALTTIASGAKGTTITLEVVKVTNPTEVQKKAAGTNGQVLQLVVKSGDKIISDFNKGKATVTVEIPSKLKDKKVAAIHIAEDGKIEQMSGKTVKIDGKDYYTFGTPHFSAFALVDADELGLEAGDEDANIERIKEHVSDMSLKASSSKTSKKNIKVTLTVDKSTAAIKEIKDMGYTVKYKYYRSTKKASKYQAKVTKTTKSFTNTAGKKGTKYYYKARIQVYDKDGNLVAQTALKQCRYAARTWTK